MARRLADTATDLGEQLGRSGYAVLRGVPVDSDQVLLDLAGRLGEPTDVGNAGTLIHEVAPRPLLEQTDLSSMRDPFPLHTDSTPLLEPHAYVLLACVEADASGGGESRVLHADDLVDALRTRFGDDVVDALSEPVYPFPFNDPSQGTGVRREAVLSFGPGGARVMYRADALELGAAADPDALSERHRSALDALREVVVDGGLGESFALAPGDVLVIDNARVLHGRTAIAPGARRVLRRLKVR